MNSGCGERLKEFSTVKMSVLNNLIKCIFILFLCIFFNPFFLLYASFLQYFFKTSVQVYVFLLAFLLLCLRQTPAGGSILQQHQNPSLMSGEEAQIMSWLLLLLLLNERMSDGCLNDEQWVL